SLARSRAANLYGDVVGAGFDRVAVEQRMHPPASGDLPDLAERPGLVQMLECGVAELGPLAAVLREHRLGRAAQRSGAHRGRRDHEHDRPDWEVLAPRFAPEPLEVGADLP